MYDPKKENPFYTVPVKYWDSLKTKEELAARFKNQTQLVSSGVIHEGIALSSFYKDEEFPKVAEKIKRVSKELIPILEDIIKHTPYNEKALERDAIKNINVFTSEEKSIPLSVAMYAMILLHALKGDFAARVKDGFTIPEKRAIERAYNRYKEFEKEDAKKRAEFEKTQEYRLQVIEMKSGIRDHIDYPE